MPYYRRPGHICHLTTSTTGEFTIWKHHEKTENFEIPMKSSNFMGCLPMKINGCHSGGILPGKFSDFERLHGFTVVHGTGN